MGVHRLGALASDLEAFKVPLSRLRELDPDYVVAPPDELPHEGEMMFDAACLTCLVGFTPAECSRPT